jgi:two-component system, sensor histidine kinase
MPATEPLSPRPPAPHPPEQGFSPAPQRLGGAGRLARMGWLGAVAFGLLVTLLGVLFVQARQAQLLEQAIGADDDRLVVQVLQSELQWRALEAAWLATATAAAPTETPDAAATAALRERFLPWQAGLEALEEAQRQALFAHEPSARATLQALARFASRAGLSLSAQPTLPLDAAFLQAGLRELALLDAPVRALLTLAATRMAAHASQRAEAVRAQNRLRLGLTGFLAVLTAAFATLALHQVRQLRQRRAALETLAASLARARHDAEAASRAKGTFLANMSHEIRTPFHGLMGTLSLLRETGLSPKQIDHLRTATESADHLLVLLNDILDMSQLESGRLTLAPAPLDLRVLLREVEALMRPQAMARQLSLHVDIAPELPERVTADATRLKQILFNLLSNAIKFSDRGEVVLDVRLLPGEGSAQELVFSIVDHGVGIDEATLARLFNRFAQADTARARRHGGTGLGLEISRNLARLMGGDVTVTSRPGVGSRFVLALPLVAAAPLPAAARQPDSPAPVTRRLRLLVAEDHPVNRHYIAALLEGQGHDAHYVANGLEAVDAARQEAFDLVLMDLHMPRMDGVAATRAIRALPDPARSTVPIVALTADAFDEARDRCLVAGMNDFLTKPVSPARLATLLRQFFGSAEAHRGADAQAPLPPPLQAGAPLLDEGAISAALKAMPRERFAALLGSFLDQGPQTVQHLRAAVRDAQPLELRVNAHAVKGAALNLGLGALAATAQALQEGAAHLPAHEVARLVQRYEEQLQATRDALQGAGLLPPPTPR